MLKVKSYDVDVVTPWHCTGTGERVQVCVVRKLTVKRRDTQVWRTIDHRDMEVGQMSDSFCGWKVGQRTEQEGFSEEMS